MRTVRFLRNDWPADALCSRVVRASVHRYQTYVYHILKTNDEDCDANWHDWSTGKGRKMIDFRVGFYPGLHNRGV